MILAAQLKSLTKKHGIPVSALARKTGVPVKTLYSWLQGQSPRNLNQLKTVAEHFGVSLEYLLFNETPAVKNKSFDDLKNEINIGNYEVILRKVNIRRS